MLLSSKRGIALLAAKHGHVQNLQVELCGAHETETETLTVCNVIVMFSETSSCNSHLSCSVEELRDGEEVWSNKEQNVTYVLTSDDEEVAC